MLYGIILTAVYDRSAPLLKKYAVIRAESEISAVVCDSAAELGVSAVTDIDTSGGVISDTAALNRLRAEIIRRVSEELDSRRIGVSVPLGSLCGSPLFSGSGPSLRAYFDGCSSVSADFVYDNTTVGINSGCYVVSVRVTVRSTLVFPKGRTSDMTVSTDVPLEHIIISSGLH